MLDLEKIFTPYLLQLVSRKHLFFLFHEECKCRSVLALKHSTLMNKTHGLPLYNTIVMALELELQVIYIAYHYEDLRTLTRFQCFSV